MRFVVYGMGAVGGVIAAAFARSGEDVVAIARGQMLEAVQTSGLRLRLPPVDEQVPIKCVSGPDKITFRPDDAILLCMKTQDTLAALHQLRAAGVRNQPIFCLQNGVTNEDLALRLFPNVHGVTVMMPCQYVVPGEVACFFAPKAGKFDIGRYPTGSDDADMALAKAFSSSGFAGYVDLNVMESKYGKLLMNLDNALKALFSDADEIDEISHQMQDEALAVYQAAGISYRNLDWDTDPRRDQMQFHQIDGLDRVAGSSTQSLLRGAGSIETDYLNGEIARLGRKLGVSTPVNSAMTVLAAQAVRQGRKPGETRLEELHDLIA